jgi:hypothetical protein
MPQEKRRAKQKTEKHRQRVERHRLIRQKTRANKWFHLHPELAPDTFKINWNKLSKARQLQILTRPPVSEVE